MQGHGDVDQREVMMQDVKEEGLIRRDLHQKEYQKLWMGNHGSREQVGQGSASAVHFPVSLGAEYCYHHTDLSWKDTRSRLELVNKHQQWVQKIAKGKRTLNHRILDSHPHPQNQTLQ